MLSLRPKQVDFESKWGELNQMVEKIMVLDRSGIPKASWNNAFGDIYDLCVAIPDPLGDQLYYKTKECLETHAREIHEDIASKNNHEILGAYHEAWTTYFRGTEILNNLFSYLNKQHIRRQKYSDADLTYGGLTMDQIRNSMLEIGELCLDIWRSEVMEPLEERVLSQILSVVAEERAGNPSSQPSVLSSVVLSFVNVCQFKTRDNLKLYESMVEDKYVEATSRHFEAEAARLLQTLDSSAYMNKVIQHIAEETERARKYIHSSSVDKVRAVCQQVMVAAHKERLDSVAATMVAAEARADLRNMYSLLKPIGGGLGVLVKEFEAYARRLAMDSVAAAVHGDNIPQHFVENVLKVHHKLKNWVNEVFSDDSEFTSAMDKALQAAVNYKEQSRSVPKASEWLAKNCDVLLRKTAKGMTETDVDLHLANAITIFRYIEDKDIFQKFYSRMLAQRLIHGLSVSMDAEEAMITKLKNTCGYEFTSKLQRMFTDMGLSRELTEKFGDFVKESAAELAVPVSMHVLQAGAWPLSQPTTSTATAVPGDLEPSIRLFKDFYSKFYSGRKLTWLYGLATAEVRLNYLDKAYAVTMSLHQLAVLLAFNDDAAAHTAAELGLASDLAGEPLGKVLRSLVEAGLLLCARKEELGKSEELRLELNVAFSRKAYKFKIQGSSLQKQAEKMETEGVSATVQQDRKHYLECTIVRIMKTRKVLKHNPLIQEVINQAKSRFTPDVQSIKKIIESLIDKQYLQRTESSNEEYSYLA